MSHFPTMYKPSDFGYSTLRDNTVVFPTSEVTRREPCPKCRENGGDHKGDNFVVYSNGGKHCFSCGWHVKPTSASNTKEEAHTMEAAKPITSDKVPLEYNPRNVEPVRGITPDTLKRYRTEITSEYHVYPYFGRTDFNQLVGLKKRNVSNKEFWVKGDVTRSAGLFGANVFAPGSYKTLVVTEGELDAMSAYQMLNGRTACVSIPNGASGAARSMRDNWDYIKAFETVVLCFDGDEAGKQAIKEVAPMFPPGKLKVMDFPGGFKDANDLLNGPADGPQTFNRMFNNAHIWVPDGIVCSDSMWGELQKDDQKASLPYPWAGLNDVTYGIRPGELVTLCAGSGQGKTAFMSEIAYHVLKNDPVAKVGMLFLEESKKKTAQRLLSIELNKPLHIPDTKFTMDEYKGAFDRVLASGRVFFFDHFGSNSIDNIVNRVHFMAMVAGCKYVFLDHVSIIVSSQENGDERKALDEIMTKLRKLVETTGISLFVVTHLKRVDDGHENGAEISLNHLRGSAGIAQLSDFVIGLERNSQDPDQQRRNTTVIRVLKNRPFGLSGICAAVKFDRSTWRLSETSLEAFLNKGKKDDIQQVNETFKNYTQQRS